MLSQSSILGINDIPAQQGDTANNNHTLDSDLKVAVVEGDEAWREVGDNDNMIMNIVTTQTCDKEALWLLYLGVIVEN